MEDPDAYFARRDTPMRESPVGKTLMRVHELYPQLSLEECRAEALKLHNEAANHKKYAVRVLSPEQKVQAKKNLEALALRKQNRPLPNTQEHQDGPFKEPDQELQDLLEQAWRRQNP